MFGFFKALRDLRKGIKDMSNALDKISEDLDAALISIRKTIIVLTNSEYPKTLHCELDLYILE